jgi:hypothetical protein
VGLDRTFGDNWTFSQIAQLVFFMEVEEKDLAMIYYLK